ncbi:heme utilization cystosolic carrier protein HutX [Microvirga thermotolerans]|uniref:Heme utilization cystosolic carrier protein HutX n=1 Tax=Microvirga thermotolerans TaxID=2651334 RepID=A0A5P9JRZ5_9HYPH|nr:heme utilization cystosolic carrier protein HutX [Microvirga thermotolerans]QFU14871.1 heme utilization cystosolic carrier protein HutX [Microvirga thermotolerans]
MTDKPNDPIRQALAERPDGVLEAVADAHGVPLQAVLDRLPEGAAIRVPGSLFEEIWKDLTGWGEIVFIVHTADGVFECRGTVPPGSFGRGSFNVHGESPIGGHIRADRCRFVYFVDRPFFGRRSCSVQFVNGEGGAMFKVFVGRNADRSLKADQVARFEALRDGLRTAHCGNAPAQQAREKAAPAGAGPYQASS